MTTLNPDDLIKLRKLLPKKWAALIANKTGLSRVTVYHVFAGKFYNDDVISCAIKLAEKNKQKADKFKNLINDEN